MKTRLRRLLKWFLWGVAALFATYLVIGDGWRDLTYGRFHRKAQETFTSIRGVTEARIYLLKGTPGQHTGEVFPIRPDHYECETSGSVILTGSVLSEFLELWQYQSLSYQPPMCHDPVYGIRLYRGSKLIAETSMCWGCSSFYVEIWPHVSSYYSFDSTSKPAIKLLEFCDKRLPYVRDSEASEKGK